MPQLNPPALRWLSQGRRHTWWHHGLVLPSVAATLLVLPCAAVASAAAAATVLYALNTRCSVEGAAPQACTVEALNEGAATLYRHRIGTVTMTVRITDNPVRMERWSGSRKSWQPLKEAAARFSTNTVCFNGRDLCVVNPNYLNSVRQDRPDAMAGRDLVMVRFDGTGRVNLSCYDEGCQGVKS